MFIEWVIPSNHLILCCPLLLLISAFPNIRVFFLMLKFECAYRSIRDLAKMQLLISRFGEGLEVLHISLPGDAIAIGMWTML